MLSVQPPKQIFGFEINTTQSPYQIKHYKQLINSTTYIGDKNDAIDIKDFPRINFEFAHNDRSKVEAAICVKLVSGVYLIDGDCEIKLSIDKTTHLIHCVFKEHKLKSVKCNDHLIKLKLSACIDKLASEIIHDQLACIIKEIEQTNQQKKNDRLFNQSFNTCHKTPSDLDRKNLFNSPNYISQSSLRNSISPIETLGSPRSISTGSGSSQRPMNPERSDIRSRASIAKNLSSMFDEEAQNITMHAHGLDSIDNNFTEGELGLSKQSLVKGKPQWYMFEINHIPVNMLPFVIMISGTFTVLLLNYLINGEAQH